MNTWQYALVAVASLVALAVIGKLLFWAIGIVIVGDNEVGVVTKKFGTNLKPGEIIAINGEAGVQADTLAPDWHFFMFPWLYSVDKVSPITVPESEIALVIAKAGKELSNDRTLGDPVDCSNFQDARAFLTGGGSKGRQMMILKTGTYRINTAVFDIITSKNADKYGINSDCLQLLTIGDGSIGKVTTHDGKQLPQGIVAAPKIDGHQSFQDPHAFITAGGYRGIQEEVIMSGTWVINPWFVTVDVIAMTVIPVAHVGVVNSFVGQIGKDLSGDDYKYGDIVENGCRGVWIKPWNPGKYAINTSTMEIQLVPTSNFVLNWSSKRENHGLDHGLQAISIRSKDGFDFLLEVQQIIHVPYDVAPRLIARFGSMANLVQNVLEPLIGNYFRNAGQSATVLEFIDQRAERQQSAREHVSNVLREYNVEGVDTLIGEIKPPDVLMQTLQERMVAKETQKTLVQRQETERTRSETEREMANADNQRNLLLAEQAVTISRRKAESTAEAAKGEGEARRIAADARSYELSTVALAEGKADLARAENKSKATVLTAEAEAKGIELIGTAKAEALQKEINAVGRDAYTVTQVAHALADSNIKLVPDIVFGGTSGQPGSDPIQSLLQFIALREIAPKRQDTALGADSQATVSATPVATEPAEPAPDVAQPN